MTGLFSFALTRDVDVHLLVHPRHWHLGRRANRRRAHFGAWPLFLARAMEVVCLYARNGS